MARPKKNTIDYFPHPVKDGARMYIMEQKYGDKGYCCYYKLLQHIGGSENHYLDFNTTKDRLFFAALIKAEEGQMFNMLDTLAEIGTIDLDLWKQKIVWCQELVDSVSDLYTKRGRKLPEKPVSGNINATLPVVSDSQNPQSIVKDSIVKENKVNSLKKEENFFRIKNVKISGSISEWFLKNKGIFYDQWLVQNKEKEKDIPEIFKKLDADYATQDFSDENHIMNTFKKTVEKFYKPLHGNKQKQTGTTSVIPDDKEWD